VGSQRAVVVPLSGRDLIAMDGIQLGGLFDYNVRQYRWPNQRQPRSQRASGTRANMPTSCLPQWHPVVAERVDTSVRGSLNNRELRRCQRLPEPVGPLGEQSEAHGRPPDPRSDYRTGPVLAAYGSDYSSQQQPNGIRPRDFQSNNPIQLRLRSEFESLYGGGSPIRSAEANMSGLGLSIDNELAARVLLAFDSDDPGTHTRPTSCSTSSTTRSSHGPR